MRLTIKTCYVTFVKMSSWVYVVKCFISQGQIGYYVGKWGAETCGRRMQEHFNGNGSKFTQKYQPISFHKVGYFPNRIANKIENILTVYYMKKVGFRNCRGGDYLNMTKNCYQLTQLRWWLPFELRSQILSGRFGFPDEVPLLT
jgi:predicted GIY-YIG superfamily endonuclease